MRTAWGPGPPGNEPAYGLRLTGPHRPGAPGYRKADPADHGPAGDSGCWRRCGGYMSILGTRVVRTEDPRLLTAGGTYVDDLRVPELEGAVQATFVRSPLAHALITDIDTSAARDEPAVLAVLTARDLGPFEAPENAEAAEAELVAAGRPCTRPRARSRTRPAASRPGCSRRARTTWSWTPPPAAGRCAAILRPG